MKHTHLHLAMSHEFKSGICCCCTVILIIMAVFFSVYDHAYEAIAAWLLAVCAFCLTAHHASNAGHHQMLSFLEKYNNESPTR